MGKIIYEVVPAGGQRDENPAAIMATVIKDGGNKGWRFVGQLSFFDTNYIVFELPSEEKRG